MIAGAVAAKSSSSCDSTSENYGTEFFKVKIVFLYSETETTGRHKTDDGDYGIKCKINIFPCNESFFYKF